MPAIIRISDVRAALRPALGSEMVDGTDVAEQAAHVLRSFAPYKDTFESLAEKLANTLFNVLFNTLGPAMTVRRDNGDAARIHIRDLPEIADDVMYALFRGLTVYSVNYQNLQDYALRSGSLSAMRTLLESYGEFMPEEDRACMARVIREGYAKARYAAWLPEEA